MTENTNTRIIHSKVEFDNLRSEIYREVEPNEAKNSDREGEDIQIEINTDSNKSNPITSNKISNVPSSTNSSKEMSYMTPKSMHNLNLLFTQSNGKKTQYQRGVNATNIDCSPIGNRYMHFPYNIPISPIDATKLSSSKQISNLTTKSNLNNMNKKEDYRINSNLPQYIFNNNEGVMSINIEHKHIYDSRPYDKKYNRKIEFVKSSEESSDDAHSARLGASNISAVKILSSSNSESGDAIKKETDSYSDYESENEVKKPQPILGRSGVIKSKMVYPPFPSNFPSFYQGFSEEYKAKLQFEKEKKKFSCSCKKSKCLKLYCECFASGEYCINCNCVDCSNVIGNEEEKEEAFKSVKDKNPVAMKLNSIKEVVLEEKESKIGCNCTKSGCSKKYCECYKANAKCTENCRCRDCENASDHLKHTNKKKVAMNPDEFYAYDKFSIEKISVLIEDSKIFVDGRSFDANNKQSFLNSKHPSSSQTNYLKTNLDNENVIVKYFNESILIEIKRSEIFHNNISNNHIHTPSTTKFKKRIRNSSLDSDLSYFTFNNKSDYKKCNKTSCETSKKTNSVRKTDIPKEIGKKLKMGD